MMVENILAIGTVLLVTEDFLVILAHEVHIHGSDVKGLHQWRQDNDHLFNYDYN